MIDEARPTGLHFLPRARFLTTPAPKADLKMGASGSAPRPVEMDPGAPITIGERSFPTFNDQHFVKIREFYGIKDGFIGTSFSFELKTNGGSMAEGGGKGGNLMGFTRDRQFIVKELNKTDHNTLLKVAEDYANHMIHPDGTLLCQILAHFYLPERKSNYMVMNNVIPNPPEPPLAKRGPQRRHSWTYDLKGCNDDKTLMNDGQDVHEVHKRIWNVSMWCGQCCWSTDRKRYFDGKMQAYKEQFHITPEQKDSLNQWLKVAVTFLVDRSLMDYSLMVSCLKLDAMDPSTQAVLDAIEKEREVSTHGGGTNPFPFVSVTGGTVRVLSLGIIDYLQDWTCTKNIAMCIKCCECNKATVPPHEYGARFIRHFTENFVGDAVPYSGAAPGMVTIEN